MILLLSLHLALAHAAGEIDSSGKQGPTCNQCHGGGATPTVTLTGPAQLMVGGSATYTVTITGGAGVRGGFNAAASSGVTFIAGATSRVWGGEVTQSAPQLFSGGSVSFSFTVQAPMAAGTVRLYAAGNSTNGNQNDQGDASATATLDIRVVASGGAADAGSGAATDAGSGLPAPAPEADAGPGATASPATPASGAHVSSGLSGGVVDGGCSTASGLLPLALLALVRLLRARSAEQR